MRKNPGYLTLFHLILDVILIYLAYFLASEFWLGVIKNGDNMATITAFNTIQSYAVLGYAISLIFLLSIFGDYAWKNKLTLFNHIKNVVKANLILGIISIGLLFLLRLVDFSRGVLFVFVFLNSVFLIAKRAAFLWVASILPKLSRARRNVIVIGSGNLARQYEDDVAQNNPGMISILGYIGRERKSIPLPYLGGFDQLEELLQTPDADEVIVALETNEVSKIRDIIRVCEKSGTKISVIPYYNNYIPAQPELYTIGNSKLINLRAIPLDNLGYAFIKRAMDIVFAILFIILLSPVMLIAWIGIKLTSPGPVVFKQQRVGKYKRLFTMFKFRTMRENTSQDVAWSTNNDPRKTRFGSLLRKFSIDESLQLFNVLIGDMSLIGPRPEIPYYVEQFKESVPMYMIKHQIRPGITGWGTGKRVPRRYQHCQTIGI